MDMWGNLKIPILEDLRVVPDPDVWCDAPFDNDTFQLRWSVYRWLLLPTTNEIVANTTILFEKS